MINKIFSDPKDISIVERYSKDLIDHIQQYLPYVCIESVKEAIDFAIEMHDQQRRASGEPYIIHPLATAKILAELKLDTQTIIAGVLHDVIEDTSCTEDEVKKRFGKEIAYIVKGLTKIHQIEINSNSCNRAENLRRLLMAVAEDARVLLIKLADRLNNMQTIHCIKDTRKQLKIAKETLDIYAPLAERIGMHFFKNILYDISFEHLYPHVRKSIIFQVNLLKSRGEHDISLIITDISSLIENNHVDVEVHGREKTPFSIWQKMEKKKIYFDELSDIFAVRIITNQVIDCYIILGLIHIHYKVISKEFYDYISSPKQNGYQSIHTVIFITESIKVEIQIRTKTMHQISELGMAAHWAYKSTETQENHKNNQQEWLSRIRSIMENLAETQDILSNVRLEMYNDQVFCFSISGDVVALPKGSTALDFAFEVSTDLGIHYSKAIVNGNTVGIKTHLQNGDQVEILTLDTPTVTNNWLNIVRTSKARTEIKVYLDKKLFESIVFSGKFILHEECAKYNLNLNHDTIEQIADDYKTGVDELMFNIGNGNIEVDTIISKLTNSSLYAKFNHIVKKLFNKSQSIKTFALHHLKHIAEIHFGYCCNPNISKKAIGIYNDKNRSVTVHAHNCKHAKAIKDHEEIVRILLNENFHEAVETKLEIIVKDLKSIEIIFTTMTDFGISKYSADVVESVNERYIIYVLMKAIIPQQIESLADKLRKNSGIIDITIQ